MAAPETLEVESKITPTGRPKGLEVSLSEATDENLYLNGRPTMKDYIRYVRSHAVHPPRDGILVDEWQAANDVVRALEKEEAGCADRPPINSIEVDSKYEPLLIELLKDPLIRHGFDTVPTEVAGRPGTSPTDFGRSAREF